MLERIKESWKRLRDAEPGHRFQEQYEANQEERKRRPWIRPVMIVLGVVVTAGGIVALPAPGPGMLVVALGIGMLARESSVLARWLDRFEVCARRMLRAAKRAWQRAPAAARVAAVVAGLVIVAAAGLAGYRILR